MTKEEILQTVTDSEELKALLPDTEEIAKRLSVGKYDLRETTIGEGTLMDVLGAQHGADILDAMDELAKTNNVIRRGMKLLYEAKLDLALTSTRTMLDAVLSPEDAAKLKALAEYPITISEFDVRCALLNNDGTWRV